MFVKRGRSLLPQILPIHAPQLRGIAPRYCIQLRLYRFTQLCFPHTLTKLSRICHLPEGCSLDGPLVSEIVCHRSVTCTGSNSEGSDARVRGLVHISPLLCQILHHR